MGGEAPRGAPPPPPPPPPLRALRQTLANRGNITKPRRFALRCQALTPPITLATLWPAAAPPGGLTSAALARDCYRRFKVCLLHFTCVIASYDSWCRVVPSLVHRLSAFAPKPHAASGVVARLTSAALARDCCRRFKVCLLHLKGVFAAFYLCDKCALLCLLATLA